MDHDWITQGILLKPSIRFTQAEKLRQMASFRGEHPRYAPSNLAHSVHFGKENSPNLACMVAGVRQSFLQGGTFTGIDGAFP